MTLTLYTANLAAILGNDEKYKLDIRSLDACSDDRCHLCVHRQAWGYLSEKLQSTNVRMVDSGNSASAALAMLESGECDAAYVSENDYEVLDDDADSSGALEGYQYVGDSYATYPMAFAIEDDYAQSVSQLVRQIIEEDLYDAYWANHAGDYNADPFWDEDVSYRDTRSIQPEGFVGPVAIAAIALVVALVYHQRYKAEHHARAAAITLRAEAGRRSAAVRRSVSDLTGLDLARKPDGAAARDPEGEDLAAIYEARAPPRKAAPKRRPSASLKKKRVSVKKQAPRSDASAGSADSADAAAFYLCSLGAQEDEFG